ncbi:SpoIIAA family protein [Pyxidicoccus xibeiensis]|uniref:STAS/SEC14 domain-containing protein n=1 Tax=Pyxidicoccus xibeiensis TaxID=2906759 RepID=UPI0020A7EF04|nr:STAS/SEC14 domain-containing protein [Pyxidicoccus xibeiensis]MCP3141081.1 STAS/SEC14 domain-containing protein [Pyxidicoccus xibeiensis]
MRTLGPHKVWLEAPGTLRVVVVGAFDVKLLRELEDLARELQAQHPTLHLVADMRQSTGITPELRQTFAEHPDPAPFASRFIFGASFAVRSIASVMAQGGRPGTRPLITVDTEDEAKDWVAAQHSQRAA